MLSKDIIADNQTAAAISKLQRGEATDSLRDEVSAALLAAMQTILHEIDDLKKSMWSAGTLRSMIDERHTSLCSNCPTKRWVETKQTAEQAAAVSRQSEKKTNWFTEIVRSESLRYFILIVLLVWAVIYIKTGSDGVKAVKDGVTHTITGGTK